MMKHPNLLLVLPAAGAIPFVAGALCALLGVRHLPYAGPLDTGLLAYALAILSFMAGVHWGQYLSGSRARINLLLSSNAVTLAGWFGFWYLPKPPFCLLLAALFAALLWIDGQLAAQGQIAASYLTLRRIVTAVVCLCLLVIGLA